MPSLPRDRPKPKTPTPEVLAAKINGLIAHGRIDPYLESIVDTCRRRAKYLRDKKALTMIAEARPGDRVEIVGAIKPRYMLGLRGTVVEMPPGQSPKRFYLWVELDQEPTQWGRRNGRRWAKTLRMPASCLRILAKVPEFTTDSVGVTTPR